MIARATTTVDILRDADTEDTDGYGTETETPETPVPPGRLNVPASVIEMTRRVPDVSSGGMVKMTFTVGRVSGVLDVQPGDRLVDHHDGRTYAVRDVSQPQSSVRLQDKRLELEAI